MSDREERWVEGIASKRQGERALSHWLRHVHPERFPPQLGLDALQINLETLMASIAKEVVRQHGLDEKVAREAAANILMGEALALQRQHSLSGYQAMILTLMSEDPFLSDQRGGVARAAMTRARQELADERAAARRSGRIAGLTQGLAIILGFATALLAIWAWYAP